MTHDTSIERPPWATDPVRRLRALLLGSGERPHVLAEARRLRPLIEQHLDIVVEDFAFQADLTTVAADIAIVLGGDGSILRAAKQNVAYAGT